MKEPGKKTWQCRGLDTFLRDTWVEDSGRSIEILARNELPVVTSPRVGVYGYSGEYGDD